VGSSFEGIDVSTSSCSSKPEDIPVSVVSLVSIDDLIGESVNQERVLVVIGELRD
jgi:hypothetical protein